jgi:hypothetical protein
LLPNQIWCDSLQKPRPKAAQEYNVHYDACSVPLHRQADVYAALSVAKKLQTENELSMSWATVYASLPVLRVTLVRDPFSWLMSKYSWSIKKTQAATCEDLHSGIYGGKDDLAGARPQSMMMDSTDAGWIRRMSLGHIFYLCGQDCVIRYAAGQASIQDLENQAEGNLRNSFAVVGILEETDTFYEMVSARVGYIDTSLNPHIRGDKHKRPPLAALSKCKAKFAVPEHRKWMKDHSPEVAALWRLYQVAMEVNRFHLEELRSCSSLPLGRNVTEH